MCGNIGAGKTTLAQLISQRLGYFSILENFSKNPFLDIFYTNPSLFAMETEITFLLQHYNAIKIASMENTLSVCDHSLLQDKSFADVTLTDEQRQAFMAVYDMVSKEVKFPDVLIYVKCPVDVVMQRISARNRDVEKGITSDYLSALEHKIEKNFEVLNSSTKLIIVDSNETNYATNIDQQNDVLQKLKAEIAL